MKRLIGLCIMWVSVFFLSCNISEDRGTASLVVFLEIDVAAESLPGGNITVRYSDGSFDSREFGFSDQSAVVHFTGLMPGHVEILADISRAGISSLNAQLVEERSVSARFRIFSNNSRLEVEGSLEYPFDVRSVNHIDHFDAARITVLDHDDVNHNQIDTVRDFIMLAAYGDFPDLVSVFFTGPGLYYGMSRNVSSQVRFVHNPYDIFLSIESPNLTGLYGLSVGDRNSFFINADNYLPVSDGQKPALLVQYTGFDVHPDNAGYARANPGSFSFDWTVVNADSMAMNGIVVFRRADGVTGLQVYDATQSAGIFTWHDSGTSNGVYRVFLVCTDTSLLNMAGSVSMPDSSDEELVKLILGRNDDTGLIIISCFFLEVI